MKYKFILSLSILFSIFIFQESLANTYFVSATDGNDSNNGLSETNPWGTLKYAVSRLVAGDTLYVRGGSYYESYVEIQSIGTSIAPIIVKAYPGEQPILDGRKPEFIQTPNSAWEPADTTRNIYRSTNTFSDGWMAYGFLEEDGRYYHLVTYKSYEALSSDTEFWTTTGYTYVGPGVYWNDIEKRIYVRLQRASEEAVYQTFNVPANPDPRQNILHIGLKERGLIFRNAEYIEIDGLDVFVYEEPVRVFSGSHITFRNMELMVGQYGLQLEDPLGENYLIDSLTFHMHLPDWVSWTDMKSDAKPASWIKLTSMTIKGAHAEIRNSNFLGTHDAIVAKGHDFYIHHNYMETEDDATQIGINSYNVEFAYNKVLGPGPSHNGSDLINPFPGTSYYHHNIIDASKPIFWARKDPTNTISSKYRNNPIKGHNIFGSHSGSSDGEGDPWKIYNNTLIGGSMVAYIDHGYDEWRENSTGEPHELYNNIILLIEDWIFFREPQVNDAGEIFDGNLYWRPDNSTNLFFYNLDNGLWKTNYNNLADFKASSDFVTSQSYYAPGWEANGIEADPQLDSNYYPDANGPAATGAIDLTSKGWPGVDGSVYRGALSPKNLTIIYDEKMESSMPTLNLSVVNNLANNGVSFNFSLERAGAYNLVVYNISGQKIWNHYTNTANTGNHNVEWYFNSNGKISNGIYFVSLIVQDKKVTRKFAIIR